jgi:hypothetical protein
MNNLTLISASYNTPEITEYMLKTFTNLYPNTKILICENSSDDQTENILKVNKIPYIRNKNGLHSPSVDLLLDSVSTDYALLVDTDVLFLKDLSDVFKTFIDLDITLMGEIVGDRGGKKLHKRVNPWHCFINVKKIKENNIKFHDEKRLKSRNEIRYDVGASFFEDIRKAKLKIGEFNGENIYYKHFEGMSWRVNKYKKNGIDGDIDNNINDTHNSEGLYQYGLHVYNLFLKEKERYNNLKINYNLI